MNFVDHHTYNFEQEVWPLAAKKQIGLLAMKVFGGQNKQEGGGLSHSMVPPRFHEMAFRYALSQSGIASAAIGMATWEELHQNVKWAKSFRPITSGEAVKLRAIGKDLSKNWGSHFGPVV